MPKWVPPSRSPAAVPSGTYAVEPAHTQVMFSVMHLGVSTFYGNFSNASGTLTIDAKNPSADQLDVSVPIDSVYTPSAKLNDELKSKAWFDAATYPTMTFKSTKVVPTGKTSAKVTGDLTLHGVTRPVTLYATFNAAGVNPMMHKLNVGFTVSGNIKRSEFGVTAGVPFVSDETKIIISAAFVQ
jgi:polyisoprenoid-binding protein YceI